MRSSHTPAFFALLGALTALLIFELSPFSLAQPALKDKQSSGPLPGIRLARLKYTGGGDWYNDPGALPNLADFVNRETGLEIDSREAVVTLKSDDIFAYPFVFVTGHDSIRLDSDEMDRLRRYLEEGGFMYVDDDYGMDKHLRRELKRLYPDKELVELPFSHGIYHCFRDFEQGWPKIHEHYDGQPRCFGLFLNGRLALLYTYNTNISDGWPDESVHGDTPQTREKALNAGANILIWALLN